MFAKFGWTLWAIAPVLVLAFHFGPGQKYDKRDKASRLLTVARIFEAQANKLQTKAYEQQLATLEARQQFLLHNDEASQKKLDESTLLEQKAYAEASDAWKDLSNQYQQIETLLADQPEANQVRLSRAAALVRAGEVFNGIDELHGVLDELTESNNEQSPLGVAVREELAAANYYGARLLREEGQPAELWKQVSETSRQQFRYLAEQAKDPSMQPVMNRTGQDRNNESIAGNLQRNLERVLDLEQSDRSELVGKPTPKDSPRGRRPGDGEPRKRPGRGPRPGTEPGGNGASGMLEIGPGW